MLACSSVMVLWFASCMVSSVSRNPIRGSRLTINRAVHGSRRTVKHFITGETPRDSVSKRGCVGHIKLGSNVANRQLKQSIWVIQVRLLRNNKRSVCIEPFSANKTTEIATANLVLCQNLHHSVQRVYFPDSKVSPGFTGSLVYYTGLDDRHHDRHRPMFPSLILLGQEPRRRVHPQHPAHNRPHEWRSILRGRRRHSFDAPAGARQTQHGQKNQDRSDSNFCARFVVSVRTCLAVVLHHRNSSGQIASSSPALADGLP